MPSNLKRRAQEHDDQRRPDDGIWRARRQLSANEHPPPPPPPPPPPGTLPTEMEAVSAKLEVAEQRVAQRGGGHEAESPELRSVPTSSDKSSFGYSIESKIIISEAEPAEVRPNHRPPAMPINTVGSLLTTIGAMAVARLPTARQQRSNDRPRSHHGPSAKPSASLTCSCNTRRQLPDALSSEHFRNADGTEPSIEPASTRPVFTVPRRQCTPPPTGFMIMATTMSLETATNGWIAFNFRLPGSASSARRRPCPSGQPRSQRIVLPALRWDRSWEPGVSITLLNE